MSGVSRPGGSAGRPPARRALVAQLSLLVLAAALTAVVVLATTTAVSRWG